MQTEYSYSLFGTWDTFFREMIGDLGDLDDLETEVNSKPLLYIFFLIATFILYITMLNLLIAIISETFGDVKKAEKRTKIWEKWNIITEIDVMLSHAHTDESKKGKYLIFIYQNERYEKQVIENEETALLFKMIQEIQKKNDCNFKKIEENIEKNNQYEDLKRIMEENKKKNDAELKNLSKQITELADFLKKKPKE